jgi:hypothetical protein
MSGLISGMVVATAPISVPIIVYTMKERDETERRKREEAERTRSLEGGSSS